MQSAASPVNILQRLREGTRESHQQAEDTLGIFTPDFDLACYVRLLERFYSFWAPIEEQLSCFEELNCGPLNFSNRLKAHLLAADLRVFGHDAAAFTFCNSLPPLRTFPQALGCLYVLEGSTLGAQVIARHLQERFHIDHNSGAAFFNAYGGNTRQCWRDFSAFLLAHGNPSNSDEIVSSAVETFNALVAHALLRAAPRLISALGSRNKNPQNGAN